MKENSSIWDLLAKRTDHSLSKEEVEALEQMLKEDTSLQRASQLVDDSLVNMDTRQVEEVMNRTWSKVESGMKANRKPRLKLIIRRCAVAASIAVLCVLGGVLGYQLWAKPDAAANGRISASTARSNRLYRYWLIRQGTPAFANIS